MPLVNSALYANDFHLSDLILSMISLVSFSLCEWASKRVTSLLNEYLVVPAVNDTKTPNANDSTDTLFHEYFVEHQLSRHSLKYTCGCGVEGIVNRIFPSEQLLFDGTVVKRYYS